jgi:superfamily II DNA or RNA helicase
MRFAELTPQVRVNGLLPGETVTMQALSQHGDDAATIIYRNSAGVLLDQILSRDDAAQLTLAPDVTRPFDADATDFRLAAEAQRIKLAGLFDPMVAVATSNVQPLPHQLQAVYGELLPRTPLRFLLADDPGAGKTIMAGLYVKELLLREDVRQCLIVAPGGLVEQWQDELFFKFGLSFEILTAGMAASGFRGPMFERHPLLIARMDQLSRSLSREDDLGRQLVDAHWDLVVIDEAHRMGAHYFGAELKKTKRYQLGEVLRDRTRHLLLMTATPHSGKDEDYQLFLRLLDPDRFAGKFRPGVHHDDTDGLMRRMMKEDLLTFDGKPLFPERVAQTVPYELTDDAAALYEQVTRYVREGMNRAAKLEDSRKHTIGFALTVLQRRLASSPEAIYQSLVRRADRLRRHKHELLTGAPTGEAALLRDEAKLEDPDECNAEEIEQIEEELVDAATAARTLEELDLELAELAELTATAKQVLDRGEDRKWTELRQILEDQELLVTANGPPRKLIVFTEHRATLGYLVDRVRSLLGQPLAVGAIHGGVRREERRRITEEFTKNPQCRVLIATDAAGEGLNLQAAHLMVNYDLPWNPNRIEQRFGRIHRIGQQHVCRLWNLVATNTREGEVFTRLLAKVEEQRQAFGGKVFDVLGLAFTEVPLRDLLIEAIRYGGQPEVRAHMHKVIDANIAVGLKELINDNALDHDRLAQADVEPLARQMDEARARRLQPHYVEWAFRNGFGRLGGRLVRREPDRYEISNVPAQVRTASKAGHIATKYARVTFDLAAVDMPDHPRADLLAPGHPLHDTVAAQVTQRWGASLERGAVLVSATLESPRLLVGVLEQVTDATGAAVGRRFGYVFIDAAGTVIKAGPAPYLDCVAAPPGAAAEAARALPWLATAEEQATRWIINHRLPDYLEQVRARRGAELARTRKHVADRLNAEINRLAGDALEAAESASAGGKPKESAENLSRKAADLEARLRRREVELEQQAMMSIRPPRVVTAAVVIPVASVAAELPREAPIHAVETKATERRGVDVVLAAERTLGHRPTEQPFPYPGFDVLSEVSGEDPIRVEVKARLAGAVDFFVTHNEVVLGRNAAPRYRLALVRVDPQRPEYDDVRYLDDPFKGVDVGDLAATGVRIDWAKTWAKGREPF